MESKSSLPFAAKGLLRCRLCRRITLIVLFSILAAEVAIFVPSYRNHEHGLIAELEMSALSTLRASLHHAYALDQSAGDLLQACASLLGANRVLGCALYAPNGPRIGHMGEPPVLAPGAAVPKALRRAGKDRYERIWLPGETGLPMAVVGRFDTSWIEPKMVAFTWRISGLVLIILAFVSAVTIIALDILFFRPMLALRAHLLAAQNDPSNAERYVLPARIDDELGDTFNALNVLFRRVSDGWREDLEAHEARFKDFADAASDWFWEMDENLRFSYFSDRFTEVTGVPQNALLGKTREETGIPDVAPEQWEKHLSDLAAHRSFRNFTHPRTHPDGRTVYLSINGKAIFNDEGTFKGYRGSGADVTERHRAEEALQGLNETLEHRVAEQTAELRDAQEHLLRQERLATLGQITATVSHELRNPMATIRNSVFAIGEKTKDSGLGLERLLERTERNILRCDRIIGELLDYTRTNTVVPKQTPLDPWLEDVMAELTPPQGITLQTELNAHGVEPAFDAERLRRAVINVFDNACQAMVDWPEDLARPETLALTVGTSSSSGRAEMRFVDTGPGMPTEVLEKVFEPLFSTKGFGVGLGMPTVKQIMEQHGGGIEVASEAGRGTTIVLWLPAEGLEADAA